ncbi:MAG: hypothetical protein AVDCRST_MAG85-520, partial [uncultured Solirubrobacteraceae bacterium]
GDRADRLGGRSGPGRERRGVQAGHRERPVDREARRGRRHRPRPPPRRL